MSNYDVVVGPYLADLLYERMDRWIREGFRLRRRTTPKFWVFMIATMLIVFSVSFGVLQYRYSEGERQLARIREYRDDLDLKVRELNDELEYVQTDAYIMRAARDQLGLIMPSEVRYVNNAN